MNNITKEDFANMFSQKDRQLIFQKDTPHIFFFKNDSVISNELEENLLSIREPNISINVIDNLEANDHIPFIGFIHPPSLLFITIDDVMKLHQGYMTQKQIRKVINEVLFDNGISDAEVID